ncbi:MAG: hypothetical protein MR016_02680 [Agathobacter sp.]|nr:hypothetical protein [Agathobacter sp.]
MEKTKLGISVGIAAAAIYFVAYFGGYVPAILMAGYVLIAEENQWLKRSAVKAVATLACFSALFAVIGLLPDALSWIGSLVDLFNGSFSYSVVSKILSVITEALDIAKTVIFLMLGVKALTQATIKVPFVDNFLNKYM